MFAMATTLCDTLFWIYLHHECLNLSFIGQLETRQAIRQIKGVRNLFSTV